LIIVKLFGGLGNQLFQYAAGRSLSLRNDTPLFLDIADFDADQTSLTKRSFELGVFSIPAGIASRQQTDKFLHPPLIRKTIDKMRPYFRKSVYHEPFFHYDENFSRASSQTLLHGYWQSERYFEQATAVVRDDLRIKAPLSEQTRRMADRISGSPSVSLHVRRGDYVKDAATMRYHGVCDPEYYRRAIGEITRMKGDLEVFVFSDDMDWVKANITSGLSMTFVENAGRQAYEDIFLMSLCQHNIIANSSFSWWGAWLNANPQKVVIAPSRWFNEAKADTRDLLPAQWIKL
jgi:glycosyl transferase family 11